MKKSREAIIKELQEYLNKVTGSPSNDIAIMVLSYGAVFTDALIVTPDIKIKEDGNISIMGSRINIEMPPLEKSSEIRKTTRGNKHPVFFVTYQNTELEFLFL